MDYSIEALIAEGTGLKTRDASINVTSNEHFDGYFDAVQAELTRSFENLEFLDTLSRINEANNSTKLRMLKRLKRVYGNTIDDPTKASSVESFIDNNIQSIEETNLDRKPIIGKIIKALRLAVYAFRKMINAIITRFRTIIRRKDWRKVVVKSADEIKNDVGDKIINIPKLNTTLFKVFLENVAGKIDIKGIINNINKNKDISNKMDGKRYGRNWVISEVTSTRFDVERFMTEWLDAKYVSAADAAKFKVDALYQKLVNMEDVCKIGEKILKRLEEAVKTIEGIQNGGAANVDQTKVNEAATYLRKMTITTDKVLTYGFKAIVDTINKLVKPKPTEVENKQQI